MSRIFVSFTYGAAGPVGAHPVTRSVRRRRRRRRSAPRQRVAGRHLAARRSSTDLDDRDAAGRRSRSATAWCTASIIAAMPGHARSTAASSLRLAQSLTIRAADGQRPIVLLAQPLAFRPVNARRATTVDARRCGSKGSVPRAPIPRAFPAGAALDRRAPRSRGSRSSAARSTRAGTRCATATRAPLAARHCASTNGYGFADPADDRRLRADARHRHPALDHRRAGDRRPLPPRHRGQHRRCGSRRRRCRRPARSRSPPRPIRRPPGARRSTSTA